MLFPHSTKLLSKKTIADNTLELVFEKPADFVFFAGEFIQFEFDLGAEKISRSYSIASAPHEKELKFCIKLIPKGRASGIFSKIKIGDSLLMSASSVIHNKDSKTAPKIFISTGTGVAPVISIINHLSFIKSPIKLKLIFGLRHEQDIFWIGHLEELKTQNSNFDYTITLSQPSGQWIGVKGRVTDHLPIDTSAIYYLCGSVEMVKNVRDQLLFAGINPKKVNLEMY